MKYKDDLQKQAAYENACDCLYYGYGKSVWNDCGLNQDDSIHVWNEAKKTIAKGKRY